MHSTPSIVILDAQTLGDVDLSAFETIGKFTIHPTSAREVVIERTVEADIIVTNKVVIDEELLAQLPQLKLICLTATGYNNIDIEAAKARGVAVCNVAGYSTDSVAQHTFASLFYLLQNMSYYDDYVKSGAWSSQELFTNIAKPWYEIASKRWGIIGLGTIGKRVAAIASAFGAEVIYYSTSGRNSDPNHQRVELDELLQSSDIVSIHAPLNEKTLGLIGAAELKQMRSHAVLINVGRGGIVDEAALTAALDGELIRGACVDTITSEPIPADNPLMQVAQKERLLITPHIAWASSEARATCVAEVCENIRAFTKGEQRNRVV